MTEKIALDTNVLIYIHDNSDKKKSAIALNILADRPLISAQVVSEYLNTLRRVLPIPKHEILLKAAGWLEGCPIALVSTDTFNRAASLIEKYDFQIFDSIIVATALDAGCTILYSEDLQHKQEIEDTLTIVNPFL